MSLLTWTHQFGKVVGIVKTLNCKISIFNLTRLSFMELFNEYA